MASFVVFCQTVASAPARHFPVIHRVARRIIGPVIRHVVPATPSALIPTFSRLACRRMALATVGFAGGLGVPAPPVLPALPPAAVAAPLAPIGPLAALGPGILPAGLTPSATPVPPTPAGGTPIPIMPTPTPTPTSSSTPTPTPVPEPGSIGLLLLGAAGVAFMRWRGGQRPEPRHLRG